jgi:hypothetical protein
VKACGTHAGQAEAPKRLPKHPATEQFIISSQHPLSPADSRRTEADDGVAARQLGTAVVVVHSVGAAVPDLCRDRGGS